ncbi:MAG: extracellular solute-binding protein [Zetaproteobacteria bacterium]|nr:MAG: extracellular solute-binding protein [Zetaproteobacteria bacterium]
MLPGEWHTVHSLSSSRAPPSSSAPWPSPVAKSTPSWQDPQALRLGLSRKSAPAAPSWQLAQSAAAIGQAGVGIQFTPAFLQLIEEGYPLKITFPKEGVGFEAPAISILKGAPRLDLAKKLVDWAITVPGQNAITDAKTYFFPVHPKAALAKGLPSFDQVPVIGYDAVWAGKEKKRLVDRWINEVLRAQK